MRYGEHIKTINTYLVAYFYTEDKMNFLTNYEGRRYAIDFNLDQLVEMLTGGPVFQDQQAVYHQYPFNK